eukprot:RCo053132
MSASSAVLLVPSPSSSFSAAACGLPTYAPTHSFLAPSSLLSRVFGYHSPSLMVEPRSAAPRLKRRHPSESLSSLTPSSPSAAHLPHLSPPSLAPMKRARRVGPTHPSPPVLPMVGYGDLGLGEYGIPPLSLAGLGVYQDWTDGTLDYLEQPHQRGPFDAGHDW